MKIILCGGGTGGSATPLIAIYQEIKLRHPEAEFLWVSPKNDPIKGLVETYKIPVKSINSGKLRRYFSFQNFIDPLFIFTGYLQSRSIIRSFKPDWVVAAGSFAAVPLVWATKNTRTKVLIHQQDVIPGLANKLMAKYAAKITVSLERSLKDFDKNLTVLTGNPVRPDILAGSREAGIKIFNLNAQIKTVLFIGGGTGALNLNKIVFESVPELVDFCQVIHLTGGKLKETYEHERYHQFDFLTDQLKDAFAAADLVVSRAGMGVLTELAALNKPVLIIPMPDSHQEANAQEFFKLNGAEVLSEKGLSATKLSAAVRALIKDPSRLEGYSRNISKVLSTKGAQNIADIIYG